MLEESVYTLAMYITRLLRSKKFFGEADDMIYDV